MHFWSRNTRLVLFVVLALLTTAGCRTYGRYGNKEATLAEIEQANKLFESELKQSQATLGAIQQSGSRDQLVRAWAEEYRMVVVAHDALLQSHKEWAEKARTNPNSYRYMHRVLGAIVSDQQVIHDRYAYLQGNHPSRLDTTLAQAGESVLDSRYQAIPPYFQRLVNQQTRAGLVIQDTTATQADSTSVRADTTARSASRS